MPRQSEFEGRIAAIEELVQQLETAADPAARAASQELVGALMALHGAALERVLDTIRRNGAPGAAIVDQLAGDEMVAGVLLLYDLHPVDRETRVRAALEKSRPYLKSHGGNVELVSLDEAGVVRLRMQGSCHGCPSSAVTLKLAIEQAIHEAAPDVSAILVEGRAESGPAAAGGLISLGGMDRSNGKPDGEAGWTDVPELGPLASGTRRLDLEGREVLFCRVGSTLYAYGARCPACDADLGAGTLAERTLGCPGCGQAYDIVQAGRATDRPELHLDPFPLLTRNGRTQVALPTPPAAVAGA
jgi:Fe-S cluster biogenesis protein NfuA/nitrite reductase/ring-hydroxylating ferredoxin subunit